MNPAISVPRGLGALNLGKMLALPGVKTKESKTENLSNSARELFDNVVATLDGLVLSVIEKKTAPEFRVALENVFPKYFDGAIGLSLLARTMVSDDMLDVLTAQAFSIM